MLINAVIQERVLGNNRGHLRTGCGLQCGSSVGRPQLAAISDESPRAALLHIHRLYKCQDTLHLKNISFFIPAFLSVCFGRKIDDSYCLKLPEKLSDWTLFILLIG